ncbi:hypothetical protein pb186bvf_012347 [Paramecium bursaria]
MIDKFTHQPTILFLVFSMKRSSMKQVITTKKIILNKKISQVEIRVICIQFDNLFLNLFVKIRDSFIFSVDALFRVNLSFSELSEPTSSSCMDSVESVNSILEYLCFNCFFSWKYVSALSDGSYNFKPIPSKQSLMMFSRDIYYDTPSLNNMRTRTFLKKVSYFQYKYISSIQKLKQGNQKY